MTTSLAMLPPPPIHAHSTATASEPLSPRRPKLSLNTQQIRTFGKGSSLRLETLSAVSPTARNTFSNAYQAPRSEPASTTAPSRPRLSLISSLDVRPRSAPSTPIQLEASTPSSASTASATSASSASSTESATIRIPYKLAHNLPSILSNSPIAEVRTRRMASARPLFPATKRVSFRTPLDEEIVTVRYTMAHSDITPDASRTSESESSSLSSSTVSSISASSSELSSSPPAAAASLSADVPQSHSPPEPSGSPDLSTSDDESNTSSPRTGEKRESPSSSEPDSDSDSCPETPVAGRRKRRREWVWTLGPIGKGGSMEGAAVADNDEEEEEDNS